jgi:integrase/recombinase XerD
MVFLCDFYKKFMDQGFRVWLVLERGLSAKTAEAYLSDIAKMSQFAEMNGWAGGPKDWRKEQLEAFLRWLGELGISERSQARILSGLKSFYQYLQILEALADDPTEDLQPPRLGRYLPTVLDFSEIEAMLAAIDHSTPEGVRNRAIVETLYACGIRVSELCGIRLDDLHPDHGILRVFGKGDKERLVPIGPDALRHIGFYLDGVRRHLQPKPGHDATLFLSRRGERLSREMVFRIVQTMARQAGIERAVSPHTLRHSFATHLIEGGADLKAVQDLLGHESITTTEIYTHLDTEYLRETIYTFHPRGKKKNLS